MKQSNNNNTKTTTTTVITNRKAIPRKSKRPIKIIKIQNYRNKNNNRRARIRNNNAKMPAANTINFRRDFRVLYQDGNTVTISGRDLIYQIPNTLIAPIQTTNIITCIPANPVYWTGTRISALAQGYQNYRPLLMKITYVPQCAVTQQGNVIAGTLWNEAPESNNLQQSLRTSNGGMLTQCYKTAVSNIRMKSNLQYNLFRIAGQFDQESNPFIYIAMAVGTTNNNNQQIIPGYFYVTWKYTLKNPIGNTNTYYNSGLILYKDIDTTYENKTAVYLMLNDQTIKCGTTLQLEDDNQYVIPKYNNSIVTPGENDVVWEFANTSVTTAVNNSKQQAKIPILYNIKASNTDPITYYATIDELATDYQITLYDNPITQNAVTNTYYITTIPNTKQNFGRITNLFNTSTTFIASKAQYYLKAQSNFKLIKKQKEEDVKQEEIAKPLQVIEETEEEKLDSSDIQLKGSQGEISISPEEDF